MALILLFAGAGLFGEGSLALAEARDARTGTELRYERFQRADATSRFELALSSRAIKPETSLCMSRSFLDSWRIEAIDPAPLRSSARPEELCYVLGFDVPAGSSVQVIVWAQPRLQNLSAKGSFRIDGEQSMRVRALVWP